MSRTGAPYRPAYPALIGAFLLLLTAACGSGAPRGLTTAPGGGLPPQAAQPGGNGGPVQPGAQGGGGQPGGPEPPAGNGGEPVVVPAPAAPAPFCDAARTPQDPELMASWVHVEGRIYNYFVPNKNWQAVETTSGIDISSPTGDADMSFAFLYGAALPSSLAQAEAVFQRLGSVTNISVLRATPVTRGPDGDSQTLEFTGHWLTTGNDIHGCLEVTLNNEFMYGYTRFADTPLWNGAMVTLRLIRDYVTLVNPNG